MRRISVGLVIKVDADIAKNHERLTSYLESAIFVRGGLVGSIYTYDDITDEVEAQLKEMREKDEMA